MGRQRAPVARVGEPSRRVPLDFRYGAIRCLDALSRRLPAVALASPVIDDVYASIPTKDWLQVPG